MNLLTRCFIAILLFLTVGCARIEPFSPRNRQAIKNQGKIEELKTNQDSMVVDMLKLRQEQQIMARDMDKVQTGVNNRQNNGVQIFQGDGALITIIVLSGMILVSILVIVHYKSEALKQEKVATLLAQQIACNPELEDNAYKAAIVSGVEKDIYHLFRKFRYG